MLVIVPVLVPRTVKVKVRPVSALSTKGATNAEPIPANTEPGGSFGLALL